jgi:formylglycine-generating enzyme required for sulfatase activity
MSDNLHDTFEEGIRDNAGHLALAGALLAHSQRKQQLQSLEASRQHQAEIAKTEAQRLEIEKQRLELEKLKQQAEKDEKEAVRLLRVMMAEVGADFEFLASRGQLKGTPQGVRRDYAMAVLLSKLALVRSRSSSLSDLNDLKELSRLENLAEDLVTKCFLGTHPLQVAKNKWHELQDWMNGMDRLEKEVKQACAVVPDPTAVQLPAKTELETRLRKLEEFAAALSGRLNEHVSHLPADAAANGVLNPELAEQAQLEDLAAGKQASRADAFANRWKRANADLSQSVNASIAKLRQWQDKHAEHQKALQTLAAELEQGHLSEAKAISNTLGQVRFAGLDYKPVQDHEALQGACSGLAAAKRGAAARKVRELRVLYSQASMQSELGQLLERHQKRASAEKIKALVLAVVLIGLVAGFAKVMEDNHREGLRIAAEAKAESERLAAEAKAKAEAESKEHERQMAEAKAKAEAESKEHERQMAEARTKLEEARLKISRSLHATNVGSMVNIFLNDGVCQNYALVPPGSFTMGSAPGEDHIDESSDENQIQVIISQPFWLAKTEVTQSQWESVMGENPSHFKGPNFPVESVSWFEVQRFIHKMNKKNILPEGYKFAMPTEAQWEYACRAGEKGRYSGGVLNEAGWYGYLGNSENKTHEVGLKKPNAWGLYDMHGNVSEWCEDWYYEILTGGTDPKGPSSGSQRVHRGGNIFVTDYDCRAASRDRRWPNTSENCIGFRPAIVRVQ